MKVILKSTNQVKDVSFGYAVNYLFPRNLALPATEQNIKILEKEKQKQEVKIQEQLKKDLQLIEKLKGKTIIIQKRAEKGKKIFGSVTKKDILSQLSVSDGSVEILLDKPIKKLGKYEMELKVGDKRVIIKLEVKNET